MSVVAAENVTAPATSIVASSKVYENSEAVTAKRVSAMSDHAPVVIREYENRVVNNKSGLAETVKRHQNKQRPMTAVHPTKQLRKRISKPQ